MNLRTTLAGLFVLGTAAFAAAQFVEGSRGAGYAASTTVGNDARFLYSVARYIRDGQELVGGDFSFTGRSDRGAVTITGRPMRLAIDAATKVAEFSGRAVAVFATPTGPRRVEGIFTARVQDRRVNGQGDPDTIAVSFTGTNMMQYNYRGVVTEGDIVVVPKS
jgi:hypothetical protein